MPPRRRSRSRWPRSPRPAGPGGRAGAGREPTGRAPHLARGPPLARQRGVRLGVCARGEGAEEGRGAPPCQSWERRGGDSRGGEPRRRPGGRGAGRAGAHPPATAATSPRTPPAPGPRRPGPPGPPGAQGSPAASSPPPAARRSPTAPRGTAPSCPRAEPPPGPARPLRGAEAAAAPRLSAAREEDPHNETRSLCTGCRTTR